MKTSFILLVAVQRCISEKGDYAEKDGDMIQRRDLSRKFKAKHESGERGVVDQKQSSVKSESRKMSSYGGSYGLPDWWYSNDDTVGNESENASNMSGELNDTGTNNTGNTSEDANATVNDTNMSETGNQTAEGVNETENATPPIIPGKLQPNGKSSGAPKLDYNLKEMGPPPTALAYDGLAWPRLTVRGTEPTHIFAIGDWGGMAGDFEPEEGHPRIIAYPGGHTPGPHVFPRGRWNKGHTELICTSPQIRQCFATNGQDCEPRCGWTDGVDTQAQMLVANAFNARAAIKNPQYVLNVGDNFYWGGIETNCGKPMNQLAEATRHQFNTIFEGIYGGSFPWISALGNHDYGGRRFINGWDQQIAYTWASNRWIMPASYYMVSVDYPDQDYFVDIYVLDSNKEDAKDPGEDVEHNICSQNYNPPGVGCAAADGPADVNSCKDWFHQRWGKQQQWLAEKLSQSTANWQIVVTHFPCDVDAGWYIQLHKQFGLDLLVTGHRHDQELWPADRMDGLTCFVTGGGGGITSEADPTDHTHWYGEAQYGFYDLTITKATIFIESINHDGEVLKTTTVYPKAPR